MTNVLYNVYGPMRKTNQALTKKASDYKKIVNSEHIK